MGKDGCPDWIFPSMPPIPSCKIPLRSCGKGFLSADMSRSDWIAEILGLTWRAEGLEDLHVYVGRGTWDNWDVS